MIGTTTDPKYVENAEKTGTTMSVYTALSKRKILQKQLDDILAGDARVCAAARVTAEKIGEKSREDAINSMKAAYDRPRALINNLQAINSAIAISNATTKTTVAGKVYTVEELIFRMIHIGDEIQFYNKIVKNLNDARTLIEKNRQQQLTETAITDHVNRLLPTMVPADASAEMREAQAKVIREAYIRNTELELVDPYDLLNKVEDILRELMAFKEEVNNALNLSNIQTMITVNLEGV